jgi:hypothetical protein
MNKGTKSVKKKMGTKSVKKKMKDQCNFRLFNHQVYLET